MENREQPNSTLVYGALAIAVILLGPYFGVHILTSRAQPSELGPIRPRSTYSEQSRSQREETTSQSNDSVQRRAVPTTRSRDALADIEELLHN